MLINKKQVEVLNLSSKTDLEDLFDYQGEFKKLEINYQINLSCGVLLEIDTENKVAKLYKEDNKTALRKLVQISKPLKFNLDTLDAVYKVSMECGNLELDECKNSLESLETCSDFMLKEYIDCLSEDDLRKMLFTCIKNGIEL